VLPAPPESGRPLASSPAPLPAQALKATANPVANEITRFLGTSLPAGICKSARRIDIHPLVDRPAVAGAGAARIAPAGAIRAVTVS
jgi:hypothetical protein